MVPRVVTAASLSLLPWPLPMAAATVATVATGMTAVPVSVPTARSAPAQPTVATVTMAVKASRGIGTAGWRERVAMIVLITGGGVISNKTTEQYIIEGRRQGD